MTAQPWATIADVAAVTAQTVTDAQLRIAVTTLEAHTGLIEAVPRVDITDRDRYWLKLATCYQAAWVAAQPDLFERSNVTSASQDGESASFGPDAHTLGPLARKALRRLSWRGVRAIVPQRVQTVPPRSVNSEAFDDALPWRGA